MLFKTSMMLEFLIWFMLISLAISDGWIHPMILPGFIIGWILGLTSSTILRNEDDTHV